MPKSQPSVNSRGARRAQSIVELEARIFEIRRLAASHHLSEVEWSTIDRLRRRLVRLQREAV
jgi:hypothetical protein